MAENRAPLGVCLIAICVQGSYRPVFSGFVVEARDIFPNWKRKCCLITSGKIDLEKERYLLYFKNFSFFRRPKIVELELSSKDHVEYISGLAFIPLKDRKLEAYRRFTVDKRCTKEFINGSVCHIVDGHTDSFTVIPYNLEYVNEEYVLKIPEKDASFKTLSELTTSGSSSLHPEGAVILKSVNNTLIAVGALGFVDDKIQPVSFSQLEKFGGQPQPDTSPTVTIDGATPSVSERKPEEPGDMSGDRAKLSVTTDGTAPSVTTDGVAPSVTTDVATLAETTDGTARSLTTDVAKLSETTDGTAPSLTTDGATIHSYLENLVLGCKDLNLLQERNQKKAKPKAKELSESLAWYREPGNACSGRGESRKAIACYECYELAFAKELGDWGREGGAYGNLGNAYHSLGNLKKAKDHHEHHLMIAKEMGDRVGEGRAYANLGNAYHSLGDFKTAIDHHGLHLMIAKEMGDRVGEGRAYGNLGNAYHSLGNFKEAKVRHELHLKIAKQMSDRVGEGRAYANLGNAYFSLGDVETAIEYHKRDLEIAKEVEDKAGIGNAYGNLGSAFHHLGDFKTAIDFHEQHLRIAKEVGDKASEGCAYGNLGIAYQGLGMYKKALEYHTHDLHIAMEVGDKAGEGHAYNNLGNTYYYLGDLLRAVEYHQMALTTAKEVGNKAGEGGAYGNLGNAYHTLGDYRKAIEYHERHLEIAKEVGTEDGEGRAYGNLGNAYNSLRDYEKALDYNQRHLKIAKEIGDRYGEGNALYGLGCSYESLDSLPKAVDYFQSSIKTYNDMRLHLLSEDEWKINLRNAYQTAYTALVRVLLKLNRLAEALSAAEQGRAQALIDIMEARYGCKTDHCESYPQQETVYNMLYWISANTVFLTVVDNKIFLWVCGKGPAIHFRMNEIVDRNAPENVMTSSQSLVEAAYKEIGVGFGFDQKGAHSLQHATSSLRSLYDVFMAPIADLLEGEELIIVPDGPLCLAPFAAFLGPECRYLCETFRIRVIPSLTTLKLIRDSPSDYHSVTGAVLVGDPWLREVKDFEVQQLPNAKKEVEMIGQILNTTPLTGANATKEQVLMLLSSVALVHIAAHGNMNTGEIALAPNPTRKSRIPEVEDYLLTMPDIVEVKLRAKLVVLSCCHSGQGEIKAEGVVGIARAFLGAGARSVLVSLWEIDDEATLEFMKSFYQHLVRGELASEALNRAMKCLRESARFTEVKHWAPFVLIGDDVRLDFWGK